MPSELIINAFPKQGHSHGRCIRRALRCAEEICRERCERLTKLRRQVLELVWESHQPIKAYELMEKLREVRSGVAPPTVYRALEFLQSLGLVHRIESLNAFVGCATTVEHSDSQFLICRNCGSVAELADPTIIEQIMTRAKQLGFSIDRGVIEIQGTCRSCARSQ
jgi:Fur family zinc uptake transcriptional regulator